MSKYLITYGNEKFKNARDMFVYKAKEIGVFDNVCGYSEFDVTEELAKTKIFKQERGGGYWTWKPDIIYTAMQQMQDGDILVYCDAGCTLQHTKARQPPHKAMCRLQDACASVRANHAATTGIT